MNMLNKQICFLLATLLLLSSCFKRNEVNNDDDSSSDDSVLFTHYQDASYFKPEWSKENTLVYHVIAEADNLHPTNGTSYMRSEIMLYTQKFLVQTDMFQPQLRPDLVKSLPLISEDGLSYTYELRDEPKWDDGSPLTVDDVIFTMKAHKCPLVNNPTLKPYIADIADIKADEKNARKFTVYMRKNYLLNVALWSDFGIMQRTFFDPENILSRFSIQQFNDKTFDAKKFPELIKWSDKFNLPEYGTDPNMFNGLGMYKVSVWEPGVQLVLIKKKNHWTSRSKSMYEQAGAEKIIFKLNRETASQILEFKSQNYDASATLSAKTLMELKSDSVFNTNYNANFTDQYTFTYAAFNMKPDGTNHKKYFTEVDVRKALAMLIPYDEINEVVNKGKYKRQIGPYAYLKKEFNTDLQAVYFNEKQAIKLLDDAGWKDTDADGVRDKVIDGQKLKLAFKLNYFVEVPDWKDYAVMISQSFEKVGVKAEPNPLDRVTLFADARNHNFDMMLSAWSQGNFPEDPSQLWHTESWLNNGSNYTGFGNAETDALIDSIRYQVDDNKRIPLSKKFQQMVVDEQPYIFLFASMRRIACHKRWSNTYFFFDKPGLLLNTLHLPNSVVKQNNTSM